MEHFSIKSVRSDRELVFEDRDGDYFTVRLLGSDIMGVLRIWGYTDCQSLVDLLKFLKEQTEGWTVPAEWASIETDLSLDFRCDSLGHVMVGVKMSKNHGIEDWNIETEIETELGQLPRIASHAEQFFRATVSD